VTPDPMEAMLEAGLKAGRIRYITALQDETATRSLDFYLPDLDLHIEVKQFHSDRVGKQMARADNVIVAQGRRAVAALASALSHGLRLAELAGRIKADLNSKDMD
jgi:hypothetical protein